MQYRTALVTGASKGIGAAIAEALDALSPLAPDELRKQRRERFLAIGRFELDAASA